MKKLRAESSLEEMFLQNQKVFSRTMGVLIEEYEQIVEKARSV